ncbi:MAG TPA: exodeoxyribonuclease III [Burkholderiales bacterium]
MKIATWNVNSLKVRLPHVLQWLETHRPDAICLQETKSEDHNFPCDALEGAGYHAAYCGQKAYNGVAILARSTPTDVTLGIADFTDEQKRVISATVGDTRIVCAYIPNGQTVGSEKYEYKLRWLRAFNEWLRGELVKYPRLAVLGDYNIAPEDRDVHDPKAWAGQVLCSEPERRAFQSLIELGLRDCFRLFEQPEKSYTWWDYRMNQFKRNMGLRIDHILASHALADTTNACTIDVEPRRLERPSDHAPVIAEFRC